MIRPRRIACAFALAALVTASSAHGQSRPTGYVSLFADYFPNRDDTTELRSRIFVEEKVEPSPRLMFTFSGYSEGLLANRPPSPIDGSDSNTAGIVRVLDANMDLRGKRVDLLAGYARVNWGKLDEIQPTDVINPLDVSRFFFEGRSEARLPVLLVRGRLHMSENASIEGIYVPDFRRGRFDQLDESSSPFNLAGAIVQDPGVCPPGGCPAPSAVIENQPPLTWSTAQGGVRVAATSGRLDWSVSAYRGFEPFALYRLVPLPPVPGSTLPPSPAIFADYPRFTMIGGDFEAVRGVWGIRGEVAGFVDDSFQSPEGRIVSGSSFDAGVGVDRRAGAYTVSATVLVHSESYDVPLSATSLDDGRDDVSLILSSDRTFAREKYRVRGFGVYNATEASGFVRGIAMASLRDNVSLEGSVGWFAGDGRDLVGRFGDSDFAYLRLKCFF